MPGLLPEAVCGIITMLYKALRKLPKHCQSGRYSLATMLFEDCNTATFGEGFKRHLEEGLVRPAAASCRTRQSILQQQKTVKISWAQQALQVQGGGGGLLGFCTVVGLSMGLKAALLSCGTRAKVEA